MNQRFAEKLIGDGVAGVELVVALLGMMTTVFRVNDPFLCPIFFYFFLF
jgi:hypothetical protein